MIDNLDKTVKVDNEDTMKAAMNDALDQVRAMNLPRNSTLVDQITKEKWDNWDASKENPKVIGCDQENADDNSDVSEKTAA